MQGIYLVRNCCYFLPSDWPATLEDQKEDRHQLPEAGLVVNLLMTNSSRQLQVLKYTQVCSEYFCGQS